MNTWQSFTEGISPHHVPAILAAALLPVAIWTIRRLRSAGRPVQAPAGLVDGWAAWLLGISAAVHLALPLGDHDGTLLTAGFLVSGIAYGWLGLRAATGRSYKAPASALVVATLVGYLAVAGSGIEEVDQVGIATALVELLALTLCLVPGHQAGRARRVRLAGTAAATTAIIVTGLGIWISAFIAHGTTDTRVVAVATVGAAAEAGHADAARAQAGIVMRPPADKAPTVAQAAAAADIAARTEAATARYGDIHAALADGYWTESGKTGYEVHLRNKANQHDRRVLDPDNPTALVYVIIDGRATLLGALYQLPEAGVPGPAVGGRLTRWHTHNGCVTLLPPGLGIVSPFGTCPPLSVQVTPPEMMHVWVVDNPAGPFAQDLDKKWVRSYNAVHGVPYA